MVFITIVTGAFVNQQTSLEGPRPRLTGHRPSSTTSTSRSRPGVGACAGVEAVPETPAPKVAALGTEVAPKVAAVASRTNWSRQHPGS